MQCQNVWSNQHDNEIFGLSRACARPVMMQLGPRRTSKEPQSAGLDRDPRLQKELGPRILWGRGTVDCGNLSL